MAITRVTHSLLFGGQTNNILSTQREYLELIRQSTTGRRYEFLSEFPSRDIRRLISYDAEVARNTSYNATINRVRQESDQIDTNLQSIIDRASEFRATLLSAASGGNAPNIPLASLGRSLYEDVAALLNVDREGAYLFSGTRSDRPPVASYDQTLSNLRDVLRLRPDPVTPAPVPRTDDRSLFRSAGSSVPERAAFLDTDRLAEQEAVDPITGLRVRTMQVIDFFTNDGTFASLARTTEGGEIATRADIRVPLRNTGFPGDAAGAGSSVQALRFERLFYQGDHRAVQVRVDDQLQIETGVRANESGLSQILLAATLLTLDDNSSVDLFNDDIAAVNAAESPTGIQRIDEETRIDAAIELLNQALLTVQDNANTPLRAEKSVSQIRSRVGIIVNRLETLERNHTTTSELFSSLTTQIREVDLTETITRAESLRTILQYSQQVLRSITQLSIVNFLR